MKYHHIAGIIINSLLIPSNLWASDLIQEGSPKPRRMSIFGYVGNSSGDDPSTVRALTTTQNAAATNQPLVIENYEQSAQNDSATIQRLSLTTTTTTTRQSDKSEMDDEIASTIAQGYVVINPLEKTVPLTEHQKALEEIILLKQLNEATDAHNNLYKQENERLTHQLTTLQNLQLQIEQEKLQLQSTVRSLQMQSGTLLQDKANLTTSLQALQLQFADVQTENQRLAQQQTFLTTTVDRLAAEKTNLSTQLQSLQLKVTASEREKANLTATLTTLRPLAELEEKRVSVVIGHQILFNYPTASTARLLGKPIPLKVTEEEFNNCNKAMQALPAGNHWMIKKIDPQTGKFL